MKKGYVYFVLDPVSNRIKIGHTVNPRTRLSTIRTSNPQARMIMHYQCKDRKAEEKMYHQRFADLQILKSEWFRNEGELNEFLFA